MGNWSSLKFSLQLKHNNNYYRATPPCLISPKITGIWIWSLNKAGGLQILWTVANCCTNTFSWGTFWFCSKQLFFLFWQKTVSLANFHAASLLNMPPLLPHMHAPELLQEDNYTICSQCLGLLLPGHLSSLGVRDSKERSHQNKGDAMSTHKWHIFPQNTYK